MCLFGPLETRGPLKYTDIVQGRLLFEHFWEGNITNAMAQSS